MEHRKREIYKTIMYARISHIILTEFKKPIKLNVYITSLIYERD